MKLEEKNIGQRIQSSLKQVKKYFKKGIEKKRLQQYGEKEMQSAMQYMGGTEFNTQKNISHYVDIRTNG